MRTRYFLVGLFVLGLAALVGWATLGKAQPGYSPTNARTKPIVEPIPSQPAPDAFPITVPDVGFPKSTFKPIMGSAAPPPPLIIDPRETPQEPITLPPETAKPQDSRLNRDRFPSPADEPEAKPIQVGTSDMGMRSETGLSATHSAIGMEWMGPSAVKVGAPNEYSLAVRNTSSIPVQKVIVQVRVPVGVSVVSTEPKAEGADSVLVWELGNMLAKQERRLTLKLMSPQRGDMACQAWVTFTGSAVMKIHVREPKLAVKLQAPDKILVGEPANILMAVSNPGDYAVEKVKVLAQLGEGLETVRGNRLSYDLGALAPGETRNITVPCITKSVGEQKCEAVAEAEGNLKASDAQIVSVIQPRLDLAIVGPKMRYLDRKAVYTIKVSNPGNAPASNVFVTELVPAGFKFVQADGGGQIDEASRSIKWFVGELGAGQVREVKCELMAVAQGEFTHKASAYGSHGMKTEHDLKTTIEGLSAILMEVVDLEDPVEVGGETAYEIKVTNTGSKAETDVKLICSIPPQLRLKGVDSPLKYEIAGNEVMFQSLPRLAPKADVVYKITVTAVQKGDARFKASLTTASLVEPVIKVEPTKVYAD